MLIAIACLMLGLLAGVQAASAEKRVALVIGNSAYIAASPLPNPINDASDVAAALRRLDFDVVVGKDLDFNGMRSKVQEFTAKLEGADVALFFYAGHAVQVKGTNYLAPIDTDLQRESDLEFETMPLDFVQRQMERDTKTQLIFLDACRNNPLTRALFARSRGGDREQGLAIPAASSRGTLIAFATQPGNVALDGTGRNSPFTSALLNHIERPGVEVSVMMADIREEVFHSTHEQQAPWTNTGIIGRFYFKQGAPEPAPLVQPGAGSEELARIRLEREAWDAVQDTEDPEDIRAFLTEFPDGVASSVARFKLKLLEDKAQEQRIARVEDPVIKPPPAVPLKLKLSLPQEGGQRIAGVEDPKIDDLRPADTIAPAEEEVTPEMVRSIQEELNRLGCEAGTPDGIWGGKSRSAVESFSSYGNVRLASLEPSGELLDALKGRSGRICPLVCSPREEEQGGVCVTKSCPSGQLLSSSGACYTPTKSASNGGGSSERKPAPKRVSPASNCFMFNGKQVCD